MPVDWSALHRVLRRQLQRIGVRGPEDPPPTAGLWQSFLERVNRAYTDADGDRYTLERSLGISSREMAELNERLGAEHALMQAVLGSLRSAVIQIDRGGTIRFHNPAAGSLAGRDDLVGTALFGVMRFEDAERVPLDPIALQRAAERGLAPYDEDGAIVRPDGRRIPVSWQFAPMHQQDVLIGWVVSAKDISSLKDAQREVQDARVEAEVARLSEKARGEFLAGMSHELRTPLSAIIGYTQLILEEWSDRDRTMLTDLERVLASGQHLLRLINDILDLSKIDAGRMDITVEEFDLAELVADVASTTRVLVERNGNVLEVDPGDAGVMWSDPTRVRQCLLNLVSNAAKFTHDGRIVVSVSRDGSTYVIAVRDTGVGIASEHLASLFQAFMQVGSSTSRLGGTGLGLVLTEAYAKILGGGVTVESAPHCGSTFRLRLPIRAGSTPAAPGLVRWGLGG